MFPGICDNNTCFNIWMDGWVVVGGLYQVQREDDATAVADRDTDLTGSVLKPLNIQGSG